MQAENIDLVHTAMWLRYAWRPGWALNLAVLQGRICPIVMKTPAWDNRQALAKRPLIQQWTHAH